MNICKFLISVCFYWFFVLNLYLHVNVALRFFTHSGVSYKHSLDHGSCSFNIQSIRLGQGVNSSFCFIAN